MRGKEVIVTIILIFLILSFFTIAINVVPTTAQGVRDVYPGGQSIQDAINAANEGDTVRVAAGTYSEEITLNKSLTLIGENRENTIIDGDPDLTVITVTANNVKMTGFKVTNGQVGIEIYSEGSNITNNFITSYTDTGIRILFDNNTITGNLIQGNMQPDQHGAYLVDADYNTISYNTISSNGYFGVYLEVSNGNNIVSNQVADNGVGMGVSNSSDNRIYYNNFINSTGVQVISENYTNAWDNGYPDGGNYWSDYTGTDEKKGPDQNQSGSDGIGDTPYPIKDYEDTETGYEDRYPFMQPIVEDVTPPVTINDYDGLWRNADFSINLNASDDISGVSVTYYEISNGPTKTVSADGQPIISEESANNTLGYWSVDQKGNVEAHKVLTSIKLDKTLPTVSILSPSNGSEVKSSSFAVDWTGTDALSGIDHYEIRLDEGSWVNVIEQTYTFTEVSNGSHKVVVKAVDKAGLTSESSVNLIVNSPSSETNGGIGLIREIALAIVPIVIVGVVLYFIFRSRRKTKK